MANLAQHRCRRDSNSLAVVLEHIAQRNNRRWVYFPKSGDNNTTYFLARLLSCFMEQNDEGSYSLRVADLA